MSKSPDQQQYDQPSMTRRGFNGGLASMLFFWDDEESDDSSSSFFGSDDENLPPQVRVLDSGETEVENLWEATNSEGEVEINIGDNLSFDDTDSGTLMLRASAGGGSGEWTEDGNGNVVPADDETIGDGTTTVDHQSATLREVNNVEWVSAEEHNSGEKTIADAESNLPSTGGTIALTEGVYENTNVEIWTANVRLVGAGRSTVIKIPDNASTATLSSDTIDGTDSEDSPLRIMGENVTVENLTLDGNGANNTQINRTNDNDAYADGVSIFADGVTVKNVWVRDVRGHGVIVWNYGYTSSRGTKSPAPREEVSIEGNRIKTDNQRSCIDVASVASNTAANASISITGNRCEGTNDDSNSLDHGITVHGGRDITATGNTVRRVSDGLNLHSDISDSTFTGNVFRDMSHNGVRFPNGPVNDVIVADNTFRDVGTNAVYGKGSTTEVAIRGNTFRGVGGDAFLFDASASDWTISENTFRSVTGAEFTKNASLSNFTVTDNTGLTDWTGAKVYLSSVLTATSDNSVYTMPFDTVGYDHFDAFDTTNYTFTVPADGTWRITINSHWYNHADGDVGKLRINVNGSTNRLIDQHIFNSATAQNLDAHLEEEFVEGDTIEINYQHDASSDSSVNDGENLTHAVFTRIA
jgi:uncharacterized protein YdeI (BOF family)